MSEEVKSRGYRKTRVGVVVSDKMDKTAVVRVDRTIQHPVLKKVLTRGKRYHVHDEENTLKIGDKVKIIETRPLSKLKRWRLSEVLSRSAG
ncbi:SSU ribosomal protein S17p (S11e) [hydrothermal vent metagenome]|uniref:SSU ribosomal protein S17p (S11e) n=1 Tax=hydrothermal vent metagenome TaxID=652676 RepID=A0A3B1CBQ8_9ZZZZ